MIVARICKRAFANQALSGRGAMLHPGRWHSIGTPMAYTASTASLALLELLAHVDRQNVPDDIVLLTFEIDDALVSRPARLPSSWHATPYAASAQKFGDRWAERGAAGQGSLGLVVPSALLRRESNVLINPRHPEFASGIRLLDREPIAIDARLIG